jgi:hypothetical protein
MKRLGLLVGLALFVGVAACGDDGNNNVADGPGQDSGGMDGSGSGSAATLTSFVIDLVLNHGTDATPATFDSFSTLPDPDATVDLSVGSDPYASLF